jgi:hypothetical protein
LQLKLVLAEFRLPINLLPIAGSNSLDVLSEGSISQSDLFDLQAKARQDFPFELTVFGPNSERYLYHPSLGMTRQELSQAGEVLLRADAVWGALASSSNNPLEFARELRRLDGTLWLDLIDNSRPSRSGLLRAI